MLVNNINYLRERYPYIREQLKGIEDSEDKKFTIEETRSGDKTLIYKNGGKEMYFHSKYNPIREAESLIEEYKEVKGQNIIFYGTGLGYHIDLLMSENPDNDYYIFEPIPELLEKFLSERDLTRKQYRTLKVLNMGMKDILSGINNILRINRSETQIIELPTHKQIFENESKMFNDIFLKIVRAERSEMATNYNFQRRWIINSMKNFKDVLSTSNILKEKRGIFKGESVLLVAAGPSLNEEIENIRYIKENGLAYIVCVGSSINTLIHHGIHPHATTTYDPGEFNKRVFEKVKEKNIKDIPLIFGSSVFHGVLENYPGKKCHMITSQDTVSTYFIDGIDKDVVLDAPTIAVVTLELLISLGFETIILVGQNLAYLGTNEHSGGIQYSRTLTEGRLKNAVKVESVDGEMLLTREVYNIMRRQMESYIAAIPKGRVINTTKQGAKINGADFIELEKVIESKLKENIVDENWLMGKETEYDKKDLNAKVDNTDRALINSQKSIRDYKENLEKILTLIRGGNFNQLEQSYQKLNISIRELETNVFFTTFVLPMNRIQYKLVSDTVKKYKIERNIYKKNMDMINAYGNFIESCIRDVELIKPIYEELKSDIIKYINE